MNERHKAILEAIKGFVEPDGVSGALDYDNPQGIHVDEAEDIPVFLDKIIEAVES